MQHLLFDGVWQGVGVVLSFLPIIALFFLFMSLLEDSGYMARAAFLMDRLMHRMGLDGKAFISLLLGYGCNVPAVMGTRILSSHHNRVLTMLLIPFSLCSARLQVFLTSLLFTPRVAPWVLLALYAGSFVAIVVTGVLLNALRFAGKAEPFIMEMPPYRLPTLYSIGLRTGRELRDFIYRAASLIVAGVVLVWALPHFPLSAEPGSIDSVAGQIGTGLAPLFAPLGIAWPEVVALLSGFVAKEVVIGSLAVIYGGGRPFRPDQSSAHALAGPELYDLHCALHTLHRDPGGHQGRGGYMEDRPVQSRAGAGQRLAGQFHLLPDGSTPGFLLTAPIQASPGSTRDKSEPHTPADGSCPYDLPIARNPDRVQSLPCRRPGPHDTRRSPGANSHRGVWRVASCVPGSSTGTLRCASSSIAARRPAPPGPQQRPLRRGGGRPGSGRAGPGCPQPGRVSLS